jgi:hypothetical protein
MENYSWSVVLRRRCGFSTLEGCVRVVFWMNAEQIKIPQQIYLKLFQEKAFDDLISI